jgi:hypothetical protein
MSTSAGPSRALAWVRVDTTTDSSSLSSFLEIATAPILGPVTRQGGRARRPPPRGSGCPPAYAPRACPRRRCRSPRRAAAHPREGPPGSDAPECCTPHVGLDEPSSHRRGRRATEKRSRGGTAQDHRGPCRGASIWWSGRGPALVLGERDVDAPPTTATGPDDLSRRRPGSRPLALAHEHVGPLKAQSTSATRRALRHRMPTSSGSYGGRRDLVGASRTENEGGPRRVFQPGRDGPCRRSVACHEHAPAELPPWPAGQSRRSWTGRGQHRRRATRPDRVAQTATGQWWAPKIVVGRITLTPRNPREAIHP